MVIQNTLYILPHIIVEIRRINENLTENDPVNVQPTQLIFYEG